MADYVRKSCFTLLELLIVLFIISFGVILTGVKVRELYLEQRFLSGTQHVLSHLEMAQDLMLIMDADVKVKIAPDPETSQPHIWLDVEKPLEDPWARFVERKVPLSGIQSYSFSGMHEKDLTLLFSLGKMSKGTLTLYEGKNSDSHKHENRKYIIELPGYPRPLKGTSGQEKHRKESERDIAEKSEALYPKEVYEKLYEDPNQEKKVD